MFPSAQNVAVMVKTTTFPAKQHQTIDFKYAGRSIPIRGQVKYSNTWECTFYLPQDHSIKKAFESWIDALDETVYFEDTPSADVSRTRSLHNRSGYAKDIAIYQLDFTGTQQVARYTLHNVFPIEVQPLTVQSDGPGDIEELSVTFSFSHFELESLKSSSGAFVDNLVNKISSQLSEVGSNLLNKLGSEISSFLPGSLADGSLLDDIANAPQKIIDSINITRLTDEVGSLFDGTNPDYKYNQKGVYMFAKRNETIGIFNTIPQGWTEISEAEYITLRNTPSVEVQREFKLKELKDCVNRLKGNDSEMYITSSLGFKVNADTNSLENVNTLIDLNANIFRDFDNEIHKVSLDDLKIIKSEIQQNAVNLYQQKWKYEEIIKNASISELKELKLNFEMLDFTQR